MPQEIRKRTGDIVPFDLDLIVRAIHGSAREAGYDQPEEDLRLAQLVEQILDEKFHARSIPAVEAIQDIVESVLIAEGHLDIARRYIVYREDHRKTRQIQQDILGGNKKTKLPFTLNGLRNIAKGWLDHDAEGRVCESPEDMFRRVARAAAKVEKKFGADKDQIKYWEDKFYQMFASFEFSGGGRTMRNGGSSTPIVPNCIVLGIEDSMEGIFQTLKDTAALQQAGAGLGFAFHSLRPAGMATKRTKGVASGPVSFLRVYDHAVGVIKQQGRHGANMGVMRIDHPDILEFISCKKSDQAINNFNLSIAFTDEFMKQVISDSRKPWLCEWKGEKMKPRRVFRDHRGIVTGIDEATMTARELMNEIVSNAWNNGEPGCIFIDTVNKTNPLPGLGPIEACNPCGEQFLHDGDVCNLGSLHLPEYVTDKGKIDYARMEDTIRSAIRFLDNVIELIDAPSDRVMNMVQKNRRVGLGIIGLGDMLFRMEIPYNSAEGLKVTGKVMKFINDVSHKVSEELGKEKGNFENFKLSIFSDKQKHRRNAACTTIAPNGSTSITYNRTSGCEPAFALAYRRNTTTGGGSSIWFNPWLERKLREVGLWTPELKDQICEKGSIQEIREIPKQIREVFVTAMDISPEDHVQMQAILQKHIDNSISKTINMPHSASKEDVRQVYELAWKLGCKGCTIYRDGSRDQQILEVGTGKSESKPETASEPKAKPQPKSLEKNPKKCPVCKSVLAPGEGCVLCLSCGWSKCS